MMVRAKVRGRVKVRIRVRDERLCAGVAAR